MRLWTSPADGRHRVSHGARRYRPQGMRPGVHDRRWTRLFVSCGLALLAHSGAAAEPPSQPFDTRYLSGSAKQTDLSRYAQAGAVAPGRYLIDIRLNGAFVAREDIEFRSKNAGEPAKPCLDAALLQRLGVSWEASATEPPDADCPGIEQRIAQAHAEVDFSELSLDLSVPQASLRRFARGAVAPELWQRGVDAFVLGYSYSESRLRSDGDDFASSYLGLDIGANLGDWQYRQRSSSTWADGEGRHWTTQSAYLQRNLPRVLGRLQIGDAIAGDSQLGVYGFRGLRLVKDERMVPDSLRGYAPVIRGTAYSNAVVEIHQRGSLLYRNNVAPGPFEIDDLYAAGNGGDLDVAVIEADGRVARFRVANASNPQLRRAGSLGYEFVAGRVQESTLRTHPGVAQASAQYGFSNAMTGYGGALLSRGYASALLGAAFNTPWGALSLDGNPVRSDELGRAVRWRAGYNRRFDGTGAVVALTAARYSADRHADLYTVLRAREALRPDDDPSPYRPRPLRDSVQLSLSWPLGLLSSLYLSGSRQGYWDGRNSGNYQAGLRSQWRDLSLVLTAARVDDLAGHRDDQYFLSVSMPLGRTSRIGRAATLAASLEHNARGEAVRAGLSGNLGEEDALSYGMSLAHGSNGLRTGSANAIYRSPYATWNASYGWGSDYRQTGWGADGVLVAHAQGLTLGPQYGETLALVDAPGARGARLPNQGGARIDGRGYAIAPYLIPYARNAVEIDPLSTRDDVAIHGTSQNVVPYAGAVVRLSYRTDTGRSAIFHARGADGAGLPFGADVLDEQGRSVGAVGQASRLYASGLTERGSLTVTWGADARRRCVIDYVLPPPSQEAAKAHAILETVCVRDDAQ